MPRQCRNVRTQSRSYRTALFDMTLTEGMAVTVALEAPYNLVGHEPRSIHILNKRGL